MLHTILHNVQLAPPCHGIANCHVGEDESHLHEAAGCRVQPVCLEKFHDRGVLCHERLVRLAPRACKPCHQSHGETMSQPLCGVPSGRAVLLDLLQHLGRTLAITSGHRLCAMDEHCGRTVRNNTPSEAPVFHQTLSIPKASYIGRIPSSTPHERTRIIHVFSPGSNNENEFTILSLFHTTRVLGNTLLQYQVQSAEFKQRNYNTHLTVRYKDPFVPTRRILHTTATPQTAPTTGVNKL